MDSGFSRTTGRFALAHDFRDDRASFSQILYRETTRGRTCVLVRRIPYEEFNPAAGCGLAVVTQNEKRDILRNQFFDAETVTALGWIQRLELASSS